MIELPTPAAEKAMREAAFGLAENYAIGSTTPPAAEKAGLDAKGLEAAYRASNEACPCTREESLAAGLLAYLKATPDAQYRRGQIDMREAAAKGVESYVIERDDEITSAIRALPIIDQPAPSPWAVPEGFKLVPLEPTRRMTVAAARTTLSPTEYADKHRRYGARYRAMLAAAPTPDEGERT